MKRPGVGALLDGAREVPNALFPALLTTLSATAVPALLGGIEGAADLAAGLGALGGATLAGSHGVRRVAVAGTLVAGSGTALLGVSSAPWQAAALRVVESTAHELPAAAERPAAERLHDGIRGVGVAAGGPVVGVLAALALYAWLGVRGGLVVGAIAAAAGAVLIARGREARRASVDVSPGLAPSVQWRALGRTMRGLVVAVAAFEFGNVAATLLILRVMLLFRQWLGAAAAVELAVGLYAAHVAARRVATPLAERLHAARGPLLALALGVTLFLACYVGFAVTGPDFAVVAACFAGAGLATGLVTGTESAMLARSTGEVAGAAEGALGAIRAVGNFTASAVTGILWSVVSVRAALLYLGGWMAVSLAGLAFAARHHRPGRAVPA